MIPNPGTAELSSRDWVTRMLQPLQPHKSSVGCAGGVPEGQQVDVLRAARTARSRSGTCARLAASASTPRAAPSTPSCCTPTRASSSRVRVACVTAFSQSPCHLSVHMHSASSAGTSMARLLCGAVTAGTCAVPRSDITPSLQVRSRQTGEHCKVRMRRPSACAASTAVHAMLLAA